MESWYDSRTHVVDPDFASGFGIFVRRKEEWFVIGKGLVEVLADDVRFVEGFRRTVLLGTTKSRDQPTWVEGEVGWIFMVRVDFNVTVGEVLLFQCDPSSLGERTEPARIKGYWLLFLMCCDDLSSWSGCSGCNSASGCEGPIVCLVYKLY